MLLQEYQISWVNDFEKIQAVLRPTLFGLNVSLEHVGSTAIPQLAAKPVIDIDLVFHETVSLDEIKARLGEIGYHHHGNQGIPGREVFKRNKTGQVHEVLDVLLHHLYVCPVDSEELKRHILFRNYLIANKQARVQYQHLKYAIAAEAGFDRKKYAQIKEAKASGFIENIIAKAKRAGNSAPRSNE
jgi:GrpB-like predicted nucleotidyltransferase (UPF0157 family)